MCLNTTKCEIAEKTSEIPTVIQTQNVFKFKLPKNHKCSSEWNLVHNTCIHNFLHVYNMCYVFGNPNMTCVKVVCKLCTHIKKYVYQSCVF